MQEDFSQRKNYQLDFVDEKYLVVRKFGETCTVRWEEKGKTIVLYFPDGEEYGYPEMDVRDILKYCENIEYVMLQESSISTQDSEPMQTTEVGQGEETEPQNDEQLADSVFQIEEEEGESQLLDSE